MIFRVRTWAGLVLLGAMSFLGWHGYLYFVDQTEPVLSVLGIEDGHHYADEIHCSVSVNKAGEMYLFVDGKPLLDDGSMKVNAIHKPHSVKIATHELDNGNHTFHIEFVDKTFRRNRVHVKNNFVVDNTPLKAAFVQSDAFKVFQGRTLHVQFQVNKEVAQAKIRALSHEYDCVPESPQSKIYECFIPILCEEAPSEYLFALDVTDRVGTRVTLDNKFQIVKFPFKKTNLVLDKDKVQKEKELGLSTAERERQLEVLAQASPGEKMWRGTFCTPIDIVRTTCDFGTIRTTQEKGRYRHNALDVINTPKSVVWSTQSGVVALKDRFEDSGNTVVIDHGCGLLSLFYHLDDFADIEVGQKVAQGNPLGTLGKTGYAKGYHLHWEMRLNNVAIDPMQWTKTTF